MLQGRSKIFFDFTDANFAEWPVEEGKKVIVVSFFGKSLQDTEGTKNSIFKSFKGKNKDSGRTLEIEGCYDINQNIVYLHLKGVLDIHCLTNVLENISPSLCEKGYLTTWANLKHEYARALLFLFSISHIMVICHPVPVFDLNYIHLFRALDAVRSKTFSKLSLLLGEIDGLPKEWYENGRPCTPRMLFRFDSCSGSVEDIKKLEHALEDQIYHILKKCNLIYNIRFYLTRQILQGLRQTLAQSKWDPPLTRSHLKRNKLAKRMVNTTKNFFCQNVNYPLPDVQRDVMAQKP